MGFLKTNYEDTGDFSALPAGEYECIVSKAEMKKAQSGNMMIKAELTIREDVDQQGKKRKFFDNLVVLDNMMWKFNQVAKAVQLPEGEEVDTPEEFAAAIQYKPVRIKVKVEPYNGENTNRVTQWKVSEADTTGDFGSIANGGIDVTDDDLPF